MAPEPDRGHPHPGSLAEHRRRRHLDAGAGTGQPRCHERARRHRGRRYGLCRGPPGQRPCGTERAAGWRGLRVGKRHVLAIRVDPDVQRGADRHGGRRPGRFRGPGPGTGGYMAAFLSADGLSWRSGISFGPAPASVTGATVTAAGTVLVTGARGAAGSQRPYLALAQPGQSPRAVNVAAVPGATVSQLSVNAVAVYRNQRVAVGEAGGLQAVWSAAGRSWSPVSWSPVSGSPPQAAVPVPPPLPARPLLIRRRRARRRRARRRRAPTRLVARVRRLGPACLRLVDVGPACLRLVDIGLPASGSSTSGLSVSGSSTSGLPASASGSASPAAPLSGSPSPAASGTRSPSPAASASPAASGTGPPSPTASASAAASVPSATSGSPDVSAAAADGGDRRGARPGGLAGDR